MTIAHQVVTALELDASALTTVHAWTAYVEDRAIQWSGQDRKHRCAIDAEVETCARALRALLELDGRYWSST